MLTLSPPEPDRSLLVCILHVYNTTINVTLTDGMRAILCCTQLQQILESKKWSGLRMCRR